MLQNRARRFTILVLMIGLMPTPILAQDRPGLRQQLREQRSPYADPTLNVGPWTMMGGNRNAYLFSLAAQQRAAQRAFDEEMIAERSGNTPSLPLHQQQPGGVSARQYFGRTTVIRPRNEPAPLARYDRYMHYFGGGRN